MMSSQFSQPASLNCEAFCTLFENEYCADPDQSDHREQGNLLLQVSIVNTPGVAFYREVGRWPW